MDVDGWGEALLRAVGVMILWLLLLAGVYALVLVGGDLRNFLLAFAIYPGMLAGIPVLLAAPHTGKWAVAVSTLLLVAVSIVILVSGPAVYHRTFGEPVDALVTEVVRDGEGPVRHRFSDYATEQDLGWTEWGPSEAAGPGDRLEVSVAGPDWVAPVALDRLENAEQRRTLLLWLVAGLFAGLAAAAVVEQVLW